MRMRIQTSASTLAMAAALMFAPGHVLAAEADAAGSQVDEVVVTARKRSEALLDVPVAVSVVSGKALEAQGVQNLQQLSLNTPSFRQSTGSVNPYISIRGVGTGSNASFEQAVGTFIDEIYTGRGRQGLLPFFDMERVEVLRGPQVLFFGNSTIGGAISFATRKPTQELSANLLVSREFENQESIVRGGVSIPLGDKAAVRIAGHYQDLSDGWLHSTALSQPVDEPTIESKGLRLTFVADPTGNLALTFKAETLDNRTEGNTLQAVNNVARNPAITEAIFNRQRVVGNGAPFVGSPEFYDINQDTYLARGVLTTGYGVFTAITGYVTYDYGTHIDADMGPLAYVDYRQVEDYSQFSQEFRFNSDTGKTIDYTLGAYYQRDHLDTVILQDLNPAALGAPLAPFGRRAGIDQVSKIYSIYLDTTWRITDALELEAGARYSRVRKSADQFARASNINTGIVNPALETPIWLATFGAPHQLNDLSLSESEFMPQVGLRYRADGIMYFAHVTKGEKAGGFDALYGSANAAGARFRPEKATSYEGGVKGSLFDRRLDVALTLYRTDIDDLQVSVFNGSTNFVVGNAAKARTQGGELELTARPLDGLRLTGNVGYVDFVYGDYRGAGCTYEQTIATRPGTVCRQDLTGKRAPFASKWTLNFGASYTQKLEDFTIDWQANWNYRSAYNPSPALDPTLDQSGFGLLDARIQVAPANGRWSVAVFGRNLADKLYAESGSDVPGVRGARFLDTARGRQLGVELAAHF